MSLDASLSCRDPDDRMPGVDQFWRCPRCEYGMGAGSPARLSPPVCPFHRVECEQILEDGFYADT